MNSATCPKCGTRILNMTGEVWHQTPRCRIAELEQQVAEHERIAQNGHDDPCTFSSLCPYCEIDRLKKQLAAANEVIERLEKTKLSLWRELQPYRQMQRMARCMCSLSVTVGRVESTECMSCKRFQEQERQLLEAEAAVLALTSPLLVNFHG